jgi:NTE family protein
MIDSQVRSLGARQIVGSFEAKERKGTCWSVRADISEYGLQNALPCPSFQTNRASADQDSIEATRSGPSGATYQLGYAVCDAAMRRWVDPLLPPPANCPFLLSKIG